MLQDKCHPQTIAVCQSRADGLGLKVLVSSEEDFQFDRDVSGILLQYPATDGAVHNYKVSALILQLANMARMPRGLIIQAISSLQGNSMRNRCPRLCLLQDALQAGRQSAAAATCFGAALCPYNPSVLGRQSRTRRTRPRPRCVWRQTCWR